MNPRSRASFMKQDMNRVARLRVIRLVHSLFLVLVLSVHRLIYDVLNLEGIRQTEDARGTEAERPALRIGREHDAVTLRVGVGERRRRVGGQLLQGLRL